MKTHYKGHTIVDWPAQDGSHWTRVVNPLSFNQSLWRSHSHNIAAARSFIDELVEKQAKQARTEPVTDSIDASSGPPLEVVKAAKHLGLRGVPQQADAVRTAYRSLAIRYHPDKPKGSEAAMLMLNAAKQTLQDYIEKKQAA